MNVNQVTLLGQLGADPEVRSFQNGGRVCNLRVATSQKWKDKGTGEKKERTEWHSVAILSDGLVGIAEQYLRKGSKVYLQGELRTRKWQDRDGNDRYSTEVVLQGYDGKLVLLDKQGQGSGSGGGSGYSGGGGSAGGGYASSGGASGQYGVNQRQSGSSSGGGGSYTDDLDDDIPF